MDRYCAKSGIYINVRLKREHEYYEIDKTTKRINGVLFFLSRSRFIISYNCLSDDFIRKSRILLFRNLLTQIYSKRSVEMYVHKITDIESCRTQKQNEI